MRSRISVACARVDITCRCNFIKVLEGCYTPKPIVETITNVVAWKRQLNPDGYENNRYARSSKVYQARNIKIPFLVGRITNYDEELKQVGTTRVCPIDIVR